MLAIDFGTGDALAFHSSVDGPLTKTDFPKMGRIAGGKSPSDEFPFYLRAALERDDVVVESATIGSSGAEPTVIREIVESSPHTLYTVSGRAVKNYRKDHGLEQVKTVGKYEVEENPHTQVDAHASDAEVICLIAGEKNRARLKVPQFLTFEEKLHRINTTVRPWDKRGYRGDDVDAVLGRLPDLTSCSERVCVAFGDGKKNSGWLRAKILPFVMAMDEDGAESRSGYERVLGLYEHGYPSFYRRATVALMQSIAKRQTQRKHIADVTKDERKNAWRETRRCVRELYSAMR